MRMLAATSPPNMDQRIINPNALEQAERATTIFETTLGVLDADRRFNALVAMVGRETVEIDLSSITDESAGIITGNRDDTTEVQQTNHQSQPHVQERETHVNVRARLLNDYAIFAPAVIALKSASNGNDRVGRGASSVVHLISVDDKQYAVRLPRTGEASPRLVDEHLAGQVERSKLPPRYQDRMEHIVAASYEEGVTVAEVAKGKEINTLSPAEIGDITDDQLSEMIDALSCNDQLLIDPKLPNIFYDKEHGFTFVDISSKKLAYYNGPVSVGSIGDNVGLIGAGIASIGFFARDPITYMTAEDYARDLSYYSATLPLIERYRQLVDTKLSGEEKIAAFKLIDPVIGRATENVEDYSDPAWVTEEVRKSLGRRQEKEERDRNGGVLPTDVEDSDFV